MNVNDVFAGDYLKAEQLQGRAHTLIMGKATLSKFDDGDKITLHFQNTEKALMLNKTNASTIAIAYGNETDNWYGHPIEVYPDQTMFGGKMVPCIRVRRPEQAPAPAPTAQQQVMTEPVQPNPNVAGAAPVADPLDSDTIPF